MPVRPSWEQYFMEIAKLVANHNLPSAAGRRSFGQG